jgi:GYF domain 2
VARDWYCLIGGSVSGPFEPHEVRRMAESGWLTVSDFIRRGADGKWVQAGSVGKLRFAHPTEQECTPPTGSDGGSPAPATPTEHVLANAVPAPPPPHATGGVQYIDPTTSVVTNGLKGLLLFGLGSLLLLCFWPVGILVMLMGMILPLIFMAIGTLRGPCPYCGHVLDVTASHKGVTCSACKKRVVVRGQGYFRVD